MTEKPRVLCPATLERCCHCSDWLQRRQVSAMQAHALKLIQFHIVCNLKKCWFYFCGMNELMEKERVTPTAFTITTHIAREHKMPLCRHGGWDRFFLSPNCYATSSHISQNIIWFCCLISTMSYFCLKHLTSHTSNLTPNTSQ